MRLPFFFKKQRTARYYIMKELEDIIKTLTALHKTSRGMTKKEDIAFNHAISFLSKLNGFLVSMNVLGKDFFFDGKDGDTNG